MNLNFTDLEKAGLVRSRTYANGLTIHKYDHKVFFKNLWNTDSRLLQARGTVTDKDGRVVVLPFDKVFNYQENGTDVPMEAEVSATYKVNGFMLAVTRDPVHGVVYSTTGTLDSDFVKLGIQTLKDQGITSQMLGILTGFTYLFEICHPSDPHIIPEISGAYLIGMRNVSTGTNFTEDLLDREAFRLGLLRPIHFIGTFKEVLEMSRTVEHEGFMIRDAESGKYLCKIKSPYYLTKKFLMRMGDAKVDALYSDNFRQTIDEEYYDLVDSITRTTPIDEWKEFSDQQRRHIIEGFLHGN
jgi:hypothetical protein